MTTTPSKKLRQLRRAAEAAQLRLVWLRKYSKMSGDVDWELETIAESLLIALEATADEKTAKPKSQSNRRQITTEGDALLAMEDEETQGTK